MWGGQGFVLPTKALMLHLLVGSAIALAHKEISLSHRVVRFNERLPVRPQARRDESS